MRTGEEIIIDAAIELENIKPFFKSSPSAIFVTHTHRDHIAYIDTYINNFPEINIVGHPKSKNNFDNNRFIIKFAHIINRQGRQVHRRECIHLHSCLGVDLHGGCNGNCISCLGELEFYLTMINGKRVTHGNQISPTLSCLNAGNFCRSQNVPFGNFMTLNKL